MLTSGNAETPDSPDIRSFQPLYDEVDLEVALRQRLLSTIEGRIQWATLLLNSLENQKETEASILAAEVDEFQEAALDALDALEAPSSIIFETATPEEPEATHRSFSPLVSAPPPPQRASKTRASRVPKFSQPKKLLYIRLSPVGAEVNQLAILACPTCSRTQFTTLQGLLNHARLAHGIEWASHDACITACATPVTPDDDVWKTYQQEGVEVPLGGNVVGLRRLFERAVGVEEHFISPPDADQQQFTSQDGAAIPSTLLSRTLGLHVDSPSLAPFLGRAPRRRCIHVHNEEQDVDIISIDEHPHRRATMPPVSTERQRPQFRMAYPHRNAARPELDLAIDLETKATAKTEATDVAGFLPNTLASRFHITARVRVEDRSLYLTKGEFLSLPDSVRLLYPSYRPSDKA